LNDTAFFIALMGLLIVLVVILGVLLGWGLKELEMKVSEKSKRNVKVFRICPRCGRDLSLMPEDIKRCPYCENELP